MDEYVSGDQHTCKDSQYATKIPLVNARVTRLKLFGVSQVNKSRSRRFVIATKSILVTYA